MKIKKNNFLQQLTFCLGLSELEKRFDMALIVPMHRNKPNLTYLMS